MSKLVFNRDGGKTDEFGHLIALMRFMQGEVIEGLQVAANGAPNMSVNVPYGIAAIPTGSGATGYRYFVGLDATENVAVPTANGSNPRNDLVVLWVDKSVAASQSFTNNSNNMLKISVVSGAPATTPADPSTAAIQAAIGAGNPYIVLARVVVGAGVTQINSGNITDLRSLAGVGRILTQQIITAHLADQAVTTAKLADANVTTIKLANAAVTTAKLKPTLIKQTTTGGSYTNATQNWTDIVSYNYTSGSTPETLFLEGGGLARHDNSGSSVMRLNVNNVAGVRVAYQDGSPATWQNSRVFETFDIPANTTVTIKLQGRCTAAGGTMSVSMGSADAWGPHVTGFAISNA